VGQVSVIGVELAKSVFQADADVGSSAEGYGALGVWTTRRSNMSARRSIRHRIKRTGPASASAPRRPIVRGSGANSRSATPADVG
jgi:hypothetical protein